MTIIDLINHDDETTCPNCQGVGKVKKPTPCPECLDTGFVGDNGAGKRYNTEYYPCECNKGKQLAGDCERKIYELLELKETINDTLVLENGKIIARFYGRSYSHGSSNAKIFVRAKEQAGKIFVKNGEPVPKEW